MNLEELFIKENVGGWDLLIRAAIGSAGIILLSLGLIKLAEPWNWVLALVLFIALLTSITRHCLISAILGFNTARKK
jgi:hypothetical protein